MWAVLLIKTSTEKELIPLTIKTLSVVFDLRKFIVGEDDEVDCNHLLIVLLFVAGAYILYVHRWKIRQLIADIGVGQCAAFVPCLFLCGNKEADGMQQTFQICIWRFDTKQAAAAYGGSLDSAYRGTSRDPVAEAAGVLGGNVGGRSVFFFDRFQEVNYVEAFRATTGMRLGWGYAFFSSISRKYAAITDKIRQTTGNTGDAALVSIRLCYGRQELRRTRSQRISYSILSAARYDFHENFTVTIEYDSKTPFRVEVRDDEKEGRLLGEVKLDSLSMGCQFARSDSIAEQYRYLNDDLADEQVLELRRAMRSTADSEAQMMKMHNIGFFAHELPEPIGGAIWIAFCRFEDPENERHMCC